MAPLQLFGPLDAVLAPPVIEYVVLALVVVNMVTRLVAQRDYAKQARGDDVESLDRNLLHESTNVLLVLGSFYFLTFEHHAGVVLSTLVLGLFVTDFFEFEAREVEAKKGESLDTPKGSLVASTVVFLYAAYLGLFFLVEPLWNAIV